MGDVAVCQVHINGGSSLALSWLDLFRVAPSQFLHVAIVSTSSKVVLEAVARVVVCIEAVGVAAL